MSLRPRTAATESRAVSLHKVLSTDPVFAHAAAVATAPRGPDIGAASVPDIAEHNALADRVSKLEQSNKDMDARLGRMGARIETMSNDLKAMIKREIEKVNAALAAEAGRYDKVWAKLLQLEARISDQPVQPVQPKGFQGNDSPFPRSTMGRPRAGF